MASRTAKKADKYAASQEEAETRVFFLHFRVIAPHQGIKKLPLADLSSGYIPGPIGVGVADDEGW